MSKSGLSRKEKQSQTRAALLDAAADLFIERGFRHVSLDEIAERAGLTKGAVYSNFADKEDLFAEVCRSRSTEVSVNPFEDDSLSFEEQMRALGIAVGEATLSSDNASLTPLELEMAQLARTSERARAWVAAAYAQNRKNMATLLDHAAEHGATLPPLPHEELATIIRAVMHGLMQQRAADPHAVPPTYFAHAFSLLLGNPDPRAPTRRKRKARKQ